MPKSFIPAIATLALCGAATVAMLATNAIAQPEAKKPMLLAAASTPGENGPARDFRRPSPPPGAMAARLHQVCDDSYAREVGAMAYLDAKLELTAAQKPSFERWKQVKLDTARRRTDACAKVEPRAAAAERPSVVDLLARREEMLKRQLAEVSAERPALDAFYKSLNPDQQRDFTRAAQHRMMERGGMMAWHMMGPGPIGPMMRRGGPMPPEGPANAPPAPPPQ